MVSGSGRGKLLLAKDKILGSLRYKRFRNDGDLTTQVDWVRGCRFRAISKVVKILMIACLYELVELFVALDKLRRLIN